MADYPEILEVIKTPEDKKNFGGSWHTDQMFSPQPAMGTILYALEVPSAGGDTMFTNQYLVYESLSDGMKALCEQLHTVCAGDNFKQHDGVSRAARYEREMKHMKVKDPLWTVQDALGRLGTMLRFFPDWTSLERFLPAGLGGPVEIRAALASTLVAGLELARNGAMAMQQEQPFGPVLVAARQREQVANE